jgi:putative membrane protein
MLILIKILIGFCALEHLYILWLEMFAWTTRAPKVFKSLPAHLFEPTKTLAGNQGLYNGFLSAGLIWSFFIGDQLWAFNVATFFLACIAVAGIYGGLTAGKRIFFVQALPAIVTLILMIIYCY